MSVTGRVILAGAGAGVVAALMLLSPHAGGIGSLILVALGSLPIFAAGLGLGLRAALVAVAVETAILASWFGIVSGGMEALIVSGPVLVIVRQALLWRQVTDPQGRETREWYPPGMLVVCLTAIAAIAFLALAVLLAGGGTPVEQRIARAMTGMLTEGGGDPVAAGFGPEVALTARFPALGALGWMLMVVVNGALAQGLVQGFGKALRPAPRMADLALPRWFPWITGVLVGLTLVEGWLGFVGRNLLLIQGFAYFLAGLAVLHAWSMRFANRMVVLVAVYAAMMLPGLVMAVAAMGFVEQWAHLRLRLARSRPSGRAGGK